MSPFVTLTCTAGSGAGPPLTEPSTIENALR